MNGNKQHNAESEETPRKRLRLTRSQEKMDSGPARGLASYPGNTGGGRAIHKSATNAPHVDRPGLRKRTKGSAPLPLDRSTADSRDVPEASLDFGRSAVLPARGL